MLLFSSLSHSNIGVSLVFEKILDFGLFDILAPQIYERVGEREDTDITVQSFLEELDYS